MKTRQWVWAILVLSCSFLLYPTTSQAWVGRGWGFRGGFYGNRYYGGYYGYPRYGGYYGRGYYGGYGYPYGGYYGGYGYPYGGYYGRPYGGYYGYRYGWGW